MRLQISRLNLAHGVPNKFFRVDRGFLSIFERLGDGLHKLRVF